MDNKHLDLLLGFLEDYSDQLGNSSCHDWHFPKDWTQKEIDDFVGLFTFVNRPSDPKGDGVDYSQWAKDRYMPDHCVVAVLKYILKKEEK